ncbi:hypothetical protein D1872_279490 [compost metagenome]
MEPFAEALLLDIHIMIQMFKLRSKRRKRIRIPYNITEHFAKRTDDTVALRRFLRKDHSPDQLQRILQKMRVDLRLQRL